MKIADHTKIKSVIFENSAKDLFRIELDNHGDIKDIFALEVEEPKEKQQECTCSAPVNPYLEELATTRKLINLGKEHLAPTIEQKRAEYEEWKKVQKEAVEATNNEIKIHLDSAESVACGGEMVDNNGSKSEEKC